MEAIATQRSGEGSLRHVVESSNQTVALYGGRDSAATAELCKAQAALIKGALTEGGQEYDVRRSSLDYGSPWRVSFLREATSSPSRLQWAGVRKAHREAARKQRLCIGGATRHTGAALPGCPEFGGAAAKKRPSGLEDAERAARAKLAKEQAAEKEAEASRRQAELREKRHATGIQTDGDILSYGSWKLDATKVGDACPLYALGLEDNFQDKACSGSCQKKHRALTGPERAAALKWTGAPGAEPKRIAKAAKRTGRPGRGAGAKKRAAKTE